MHLSSPGVPTWPMHPVWASLLAAAALAACGGKGGAWHPVNGSVRAAGIEVKVLDVSVNRDPQPWQHPPAGTQCIVYRLEVWSVDGKTHDLRPDDFRAGSDTPFDAVARCSSPQLEPTWIGSRSRIVYVTVLEPDGPPGTLMWRPA
jgi:hypothetical protein